MSGTPFGSVPAALLLASGLSFGWHPVPTLGTLAEVLAFAAVAAVIAAARVSVAPLSPRAFALGAGGVLSLLLARSVLQALLPGTDDHFWVGPALVLGLGLLIVTTRSAEAEYAMRTVASAVLVTALVNAAVGLLQYWQAYALLDPLGRLVYVEHGVIEASGNVAQKNVLATVSLLGIAASTYLRRAPTAGTLAVEVLLAYVVALTASRTPWAIIGAVTILAVLHHGPRGALATPVLRRFVLPVMLLSLATPWINAGIAALSGAAVAGDTLTRIGSDGFGIRWALFGLAAGIVLENPLLGTGWRSAPGEMIEAAMRHGGWGNAELPVHVHNVFLQLSLELGLLVSLPVLAYLVVRVVRRPPANPAGQFAWLGVLILIVHSQFEFPLWHPGLLLLACFLLSHLDAAGIAAAGPGGVVGAPARRFALARIVAALACAGALLTIAQLVRVSVLWEAIGRGVQHTALAGELRGIGRNPLLAPYARWVEANAPGIPAPRRIELLASVARWLPDTHVLTELRSACLEAGRHRDAAAIEARLFRVFGMRFDPGGSN